MGSVGLGLGSLGLGDGSGDGDALGDGDGDGVGDGDFFGEGEGDGDGMGDGEGSPALSPGSYADDPSTWGPVGDGWGEGLVRFGFFAVPFAGSGAGEGTGLGVSDGVCTARAANASARLWVGFPPAASCTPIAATSITVPPSLAAARS